MKERNLIYSQNVWAGISNWFYRGGKVSGPPEVLRAFSGTVSNDLERAALSLVKRIIPFPLLFDKLYVVSEIPLTDGFTNDLKKCLGVHFLQYKQIRDVVPEKEEIEGCLQKILASRDNADLIRKLYRISGPFAADLPDLIPVMRNMLVSMRLSKKLNASLNCRNEELDVHKWVGKNFTTKDVDEKVDIMQAVLRLHKMPILNADAFRNKDKSINLDNLFSSLETVRKSKYLVRFREKIDDFFQNESKNMSDVIFEDLINDLRRTLEEYVLVPGEITKRMSTAVLMDIIGAFVPGAGTIKDAAALKKQKTRSADMEWRLFVFDYGDQIKCRDISEHNAPEVTP